VTRVQKVNSRLVVKDVHLEQVAVYTMCYSRTGSNYRVQPGTIEVKLKGVGVWARWSFTAVRDFPATLKMTGRWHVNGADGAIGQGVVCFTRRPRVLFLSSALCFCLSY
jgi:hypothetical protein